MALPELPTIVDVLDQIQSEFNAIDTLPELPSKKEIGQFFLDLVNNMADKLGLPEPFTTPMPDPPDPPSLPSGLPELPPLPRTAQPFNLPIA